MKIKVCSLLFVLAATAFAGNKAPAISGDYLEVRSCDVYTGYCFANSEMNLAGKEGLMLWSVREGEWKGVMDLFGYPINVALKLANVPGGTAAAQFHIVGKRDSTVALDVVIEENGNLLVQSTESGIAYEGRLQKDEISGTYRQGPLEAPLNLRPAPKGASGARP